MSTPSDTPTNSYRYYVLFLLTIVAAFHYLDRAVLGLLVEPIKQDLNLSDTQIGVLNGFAFALFYAVAGIPLARWADKGNRNYVVSVTTGLWSVMLSLSAYAASFTQLLLIRVGVAVGEAGCIPAGQSLISDYFGRAERPRAMSIYWLCGPIAGIIAYLAGGYLAETYGWRMTFLILGIPGVAVAILVKLTMREPRLHNPVAKSEEHPPLLSVLRHIWRQPSFRNITAAFCVATFFMTGIGIWAPAFFIRSHGMSLTELGIWFAAITGVGGLIGTFLGGFLASHFAPKNEPLQMRAIAVILLVSGALSMAMYLAQSKYVALGIMAVFNILIMSCFGPVYSAFQSLVTARMRAASMAIVQFFSNLIGLGAGPLAAGMLSDALTPSLGAEALRYTLVILSPGFVWCAWHYWQASKTIAADVMAVEGEQSRIGSTSSQTDIDRSDDRNRIDAV